jgi:hypothetical protein
MCVTVTYSNTVRQKQPDIKTYYTVSIPMGQRAGTSMHHISTSSFTVTMFNQLLKICAEVQPY